MTWNRLTNEQRYQLIDLPVWTTEEDRRRALSYVDPNFGEVHSTVAAVLAGLRAPSNLGVIVAVARYEDAGWMPDGCFERWRRRILRGTEQMLTPDLVKWLSSFEEVLKHDLHDREVRLTAEWHAKQERLAEAQTAVSRSHQQLLEHLRKIFMCRLSVGDTDGAREIAIRSEDQTLFQLVGRE